MRIYEVVFVMKPDVPEEEVDKFVAQMENVVTSTGGAVQKVDKWGRRRLAYKVRGQREGQYVLFVIEGGPATVREFERVLKVSEPVIKFQTVRIDEELKRLQKLKEQRDKRSAARGARAPQPAAPPPAAPDSTPETPVV
jgi:small subunit ribosomal protein S6